jgi:hypothetical protein
MAYETKYTISFTNEASQLVEILLRQKDAEPGILQSYAVVNATLMYEGSEGKLASIYGMNLSVELDMQPDELDFWGSFATAKKGEWRVVVLIDSKTFFEGFALADEGAVPFQDRPYNAKISASDGIGLLRDVDLIKPDDTEFNSHHSIIEYIAACLQQTGLDLPIRVYDNMYHSSFANRDTDPKWDMVGQTYLECRTFLKDATTFLNCYEVLERICKNAFRVFQWNGKWVIIRLGMLQYYPFVGYYTEYDYTGANAVGYEIFEQHASVGKNEMIYPHGKDQIKYVKKALKKSTMTFDYEVWPEIPRNNKFERGTQIGSGIAYDEIDDDGDGDRTEVLGTYKDFTIPDWDSGVSSTIGKTLDPTPFSTLDTSITDPILRKVYNVYDVELRREIIMNAPADGIYVMRSEGIPVREGGRIKFGLDKRFEIDIATSDPDRTNAALIYIVSEDETVGYALSNPFSGSPQSVWVNYTFYAFGTGYIKIAYSADDDATIYHSTNVESQPIPINGTMYICLISIPNGGKQYFRNIEFEYFPYAAGGFRPVRGETVTYEQTQQNWPDKADDKIYLADNPHKVFKGCLLNSLGIPLTPSWYRLGEEETHSYMWWCNYFVFQLQQRRYQMIEGSFSSLMDAPNNDQEVYEPVGPHKQYRFSDVPNIDQRFVLSAPLEMNLKKAWLRASFWEVFIATQIFFDGVRAGQSTFKYNF